MFGIGFWEFVLILIVALLVLGPERIGPIMRTLGRVMREIQKGAGELRSALRIDEETDRIDELKRKIVHDITADEERAGEAAETRREPEAPRWDQLHDAAQDDDKDKKKDG